MLCSAPPALTDDQISALLDGTATLDEQAHLGACSYCHERFDGAAAVEQRLTTTLHRWDCPPAQQLGDYHLGLLSAEADRSIVKHLEFCASCSAEIEELRRFLAAPAVAQAQQQPAPNGDPRRRRWGEAVARLVPRSPTMALRGAAHGPHVAETDDATVIVDTKHVADEQLMVSGQVAADDQEQWTGALVEVRQQRHLVATARVDDLGAWQCGPLRGATMEIRITSQTGRAIVLPEPEP